MSIIINNLLAFRTLVKYIGQNTSRDIFEHHGIDDRLQHYTWLSLRDSYGHEAYDTIKALPDEMLGTTEFVNLVNQSIYWALVSDADLIKFYEQATKGALTNKPQSFKEFV